MKKLNFGMTLYLVVFGLMVFFHFIETFSSEDGWSFFFFSVIPLDALISGIFMSPLLISNFAHKKVHNDVKNESMSEFDFSNFKSYYRDILDKYSLIELSFIDDFNIDYPRDIIIILLSLMLKGKIIINNNLIEIVEFNEFGLKKIENLILKSIKNGKVILKNSAIVRECVVKEAIDDGLIVKISDELYDYSKKEYEKTLFLNYFGYLFFFIFVVILFFLFGESLLFLIIKNSSIAHNIHSVVMFILSLLFFGYISFFIGGGLHGMNYSYSNLKRKSYERTVKGEEVNKKLEGLKNYIKDFSILNEREQQELMVWEEYLIYSVLFNQNQKVFDELSFLVEAEYEDGKV